MGELRSVLNGIRPHLEIPPGIVLLADRHERRAQDWIPLTSSIEAFTVIANRLLIQKSCSRRRKRHSLNFGVRTQLSFRAQGGGPSARILLPRWAAKMFLRSR